MVTAEDFADYVGENYATSGRKADIDNSLSAASAHLATKTGVVFRPIPPDLYDWMVREVAKNLYKRTNNNNGQYESTDNLQPANDPLQPVRAVLKDYVSSV